MILNRLLPRTFPTGKAGISNNVTDEKLVKTSGKEVIIARITTPINAPENLPEWYNMLEYDAAFIAKKDAQVTASMYIG